MSDNAAILSWLQKIDAKLDLIDGNTDELELKAESINLNTDDVEGKLDTIAGNQLSDNHQVTVSNPTADPETGLAKEVTLQSIDTELAAQQKDALTDTELRASDVAITLDGEQVAVSNFPAVQPVSDNGGSLTVDNPTLSVVGAGAAATAQRVHLSSESLAALEDINVTVSSEIEIKNDSGNPIPVSGTISANQSGSWEVALDAASLAALETINVGNEVEVTLNGEAVTVNGTVSANQSGAWEVSLSAASLAALETTTVNQGTSPWVVSGTVTSTPSGTQNVDVVGNTIGLATSANQLPDNHQVTVSNPITGFATAANQLPDNHQVTVSNPTADPETGLAKEVTLQSIDTELATQQKDALTDAELRASDVNVSLDGETVAVSNPSLSVTGAGAGATAQRVQLSDESLVALENITVTIDNEVEVKNDAGNPIPVSGTIAATQSGGWEVSLDTATLASLETINVGNEVEVTLNGESVTVTGTVAATQSGSWEVSLDAASLSALETVTVEQGTSPWVVSGTVTATPSGTQDVNIVSDAAGLATAANQLPDGHNVTVTNPTADPETGLAKEVTLQSIDTELAAQQKDALTDAELRASAVDVSDSSVLAALVNRYGGGKSAASATLTNTTETAIHTPAAGNAVRVYWVSAINRDPATSFPAVTIRIGSTVIYKASAVSHWEKFVGAADEAVTAQLSTSGTVDVTIHYEEFTP